jgi:hypothetical protein
MKLNFGERVTVASLLTGLLFFSLALIKDCVMPTNLDKRLPGHGPK